MPNWRLKGSLLLPIRQTVPRVRPMISVQENPADAGDNCHTHQQIDMLSLVSLQERTIRRLQGSETGIHHIKKTFETSPITAELKLHNNELLYLSFGTSSLRCQ